LETLARFERRGRLASAAALISAIALCLPSARSEALEFFDGRIQAHGFAEMQIRVIDEQFGDNLDLAQWYNVVNLEVEVDVLPKGWGPINLLQAYVRVEGRYDCVWKRGCGMFRSVNTYGNRARRLPNRLSDGMTQDYAGALQVGSANDDNPRQDIQTLNGDRSDGSVIPNRGAFDYWRIRDIEGADNIPNTNDDPFRYTMSQYLDFAFTSVAHRGADGGVLQKDILGPWLPKNELDANAALRYKANPFRGRLTPSPGGGDPGFTRWHSADPIVNPGFMGAPDIGNPFFDTYDPFPQELLQFLPPDLVVPGTQIPGTYLLSNGKEVVLTEQTAGQYINKGTNPFGGDYTGVSPCVVPGTPRAAAQVALGIQPGCVPFTNVRVTGGTSELPLRPAPDASHLAKPAKRTDAQGLYVPSRGLTRVYGNSGFDDVDMNYDQSDLSWNRGESQQETKELKEAYVEASLFDDRFWMRLGLQQIVWGKTELFRTTDQFNAQDLGLSTLPSLEESRIATNSARFIYSLYDVGVLDDVRLEFALNFDKVKRADLGVCGEPYAVAAACALSSAAFTHGILGVGVAGEERPPNAWDDPDGLEYGGRIEWRWDRFSFALTDFYGYDDFPIFDQFMTFERNTDVLTGRPLVTRFNPGNPRGHCTIAFATDPRDQGSVTALGIGTDPDCLGFGTPATNPCTIKLAMDPNDPDCLALVTPSTSRKSLNNALEWHSANQQAFAWLCSATVGITPELDTRACALNLFNSSERLGGLPISLTEVSSSFFAGEYRFNRTFAATAQLIGMVPLVGPTPTQSINRDANDGFITSIFGSDLDCVDMTGTVVGRSPGCNVLSTNGGINRGPIGGNPLAKQLPTREDYFTLDSGLTNEQRALLGCGPFFGTRCDSSVTFAKNDCDPLSLEGCVVTEATRLSFYNEVIPGTAHPGGGIDLLNMEASAIMQSFPGFDGTPKGYITTSRAVAPGTIDFDGGPVCTRYVPGQDRPVKLPGCRGIDSYEITNTEVIFTFEKDYDPRVDGCLLAPTIATHNVVTLDSNGNDITGSTGMQSCFGQLAPSTGDFDPAGPAPSTLRPCDSLVNDPACQAEVAEYLDKRNSDSLRGDYTETGAHVFYQHASTLYHPTAGCLSDAEIALQQAMSPEDGPQCNFIPSASGVILSRDYDAEFLAGTAQIFKNELAAVSWNFAMGLVVTSACTDDDGRKTDPECFDAEHPWVLNKCSFNQPQFCKKVKEFFDLGGVQRNTLRAAGNSRFGRRTFLWHSGSEVALNYDRRNVFGFSMDFPEDRTRSNWGVEFTWFESVPVYDANEFDSLTDVDMFNLTVSIDRPTFINFLNPNRTFFFNTQWFFQYIKGHRSGMGPNGKYSVMFTNTIMTGYFQDRLNPSLVTIYDFNSRSGGVLPSVQYRFTESLSVAVGMAIFFGRTQLSDMSINPFRPATNRVGKDAYRDSSEHFLSSVRRRDEIWMRLRWTF
jgi:hypothetical protein